MNRNYQDQVIWITGASSGIGEALAHAYTALGAIVIASAPSSKELEDARLRDAHPERFHPWALDLLQSDQIPIVARQVIDTYGRVDMLFNNAGISQRSLIEETTIDLDRKIMEVNYFGAVILTKAVLPQMLKQGRGHVACTTSMVGRFGFPLRSAYSAAKHAQFGFFETLRAECHDRGIQVHIIIGGRIQTAISFHALTKDGTEHAQMDQGQKKGISPQDAAQKIIKGVAKGRREIRIGASELLILPIKRFFPGLHARIVRKISAT